MTHPRRIRILFSALLAGTLGLASCSDSESKNTASAPEFAPDTSYLDQLAQDEGVETPSAQDIEPEPAVDEPQAIAPAEKEYTDEEREWVSKEGSRSIYGRSRDRAKDLRDRLQDSTEPENGLAITAFDEEYAQAAGFAWDMPEEWIMAVPGAGRFAEMYIKNPLGNASVSFSKETGSIAQIKRTLESYISDTYGGRSSARPTTKVVMGHTVTVFDLEGSYIDPSNKGSRNESPFYAIHAVVIELPTTKVLVKMWGPQETINQSKYAFDAMIEKMYEK